MKTAKLGIIGLGYIGQLHLRHCLKIPNAKVLAVADISKKALNKAKKSGVKKTFTNYEDLLKESGIDAVIIGLPTHLHLNCAIAAAEAGKDVFLEKPIARTVEEAKEIISVVQKNSVKLMMGYHMRFNNEFIAVKEKIKNGLIGDVENAHATFISSGPFFHRAEGHAPVPVPDWWFNKELTGGGVLVDLGCHMINLLRWYFGEITDIRSHLGYRFNMNFEDSALCLAKFNSGTVAIINVGWFSQEYLLRIDMLGSVKNISAQHSPSNPIESVVQMIANGYTKFYQAHFDEMRYFINCIINDFVPSSTGQDGLRDLEAITFAYKKNIFLI
ncbi:MAG: Gfo/Idh/MocA family oxidoreductase [Candidatus Bathyarchaeota archaeon]|nr:Gfo/Idh/MocA family oxidoreductase [Candidatus Bathyarchaeota archaeon]